MPNHIWRQQPSSRLNSSDLIKDLNTDVSYKIANKGFFQLSPDIISQALLRENDGVLWNTSGCIKVWDGLGWVSNPAKIWNGMNWITI